jgi:hypothetical protein
MHNDWLAEERREQKSADADMGKRPFPKAGKQTTAQAMSPRTRAKHMAKAALGPDEPAVHQLMPIRMIPGYKGGKQQRCIICSSSCSYHVSWCCSCCSTFDNVAALHPPVMGKGKHKIYWGCLKYHQMHPDDAPKVNIDTMSRMKRAHTGPGSSKCEPCEVE